MRDALPVDASSVFASKVLVDSLGSNRDRDGADPVIGTGDENVAGLRCEAAMFEGQHRQHYHVSAVPVAIASFVERGAGILTVHSLAFTRAFWAYPP